MAILVVLPWAVSQGASGNAELSLSVADASLSPGEQTTVTVLLKTDELDLEEGEEISTLSAFINFPADKLEIIGDLNYNLSAFPTAYVSELDNAAGTLEIVRGRAGTGLPNTATVVSFEIRAKTGSNGDADIRFDTGLSGVLLNDAANSDVLGSAAGKTISIAGNEEPRNSSSPQPGSSPTSEKARIFMTLSKAQLAPGQTATANLYLDTGINSVSSADIRLTFPADDLEAIGNTVSVSGGAFSGVSQNSINDGSIDLVVFNNPPITSANAFVGSFTVKRKTIAESAISIANSTGVYINDINNTNVLSKPASSGLIFPLLNGPVVIAALSSGSISVAESAAITFESSETGTYQIKPDCNAPTIYGSGQVVSANEEVTAYVSGTALGIGENKTFRVCVTDSQGNTGGSEILSLIVTKSETIGVSACSLAPNPVIPGQASALEFITAEAGTVSVHLGSCEGRKLPLGFAGGKYENYTVFASSTSCASGKNTVTLTANDIGGAGEHVLAVCLTTVEGKKGSSTLPISIYSSSRSGGGGGGGGGRRSGKGSNTGSTEKNSETKAVCEIPQDFSVKALTSGKILFLWQKITDPNVTGLKLSWEALSGNKNGTIEIPLLTRLIFPADELKSGEEYEFTLHAVGDCEDGISESVNAEKLANGKTIPKSSARNYRPPNGTSGMSASIIPPQSSGSTASSSRSLPSGSSSGSFSPSSSHRSPQSGVASGGVRHTGTGRTKVGNTAGNQSTDEESYISLPPAVSDSGPIAGGLIFLSGVTALILRQGRKKS